LALVVGAVEGARAPVEARPARVGALGGAESVVVDREAIEAITRIEGRVRCVAPGSDRVGRYDVAGVRVGLARVPEQAALTDAARSRNEEQSNATERHPPHLERIAQKTRDDVRKTRDDVRKTRDDVRKTRDDVRKTRDDVRKTRDDVRKTRDDVRKTRDDVRKTRDDVRKTRDDVRKTRDDVRKTRDDVRKTRHDVRKTRDDFR